MLLPRYISLWFATKPSFYWNLFKQVIEPQKGHYFQSCSLVQEPCWCSWLILCKSWHKIRQRQHLLWWLPEQRVCQPTSSLRKFYKINSPHHKTDSNSKQTEKPSAPCRQERRPKTAEAPNKVKVMAQWEHSGDTTYAWWLHSCSFSIIPI